MGVQLYILNMNEKLIHLQNLYRLLDFEPYILIGALILFAWFFYRLFLKAVSEERHRSLRGHFRNLVHHYIVISVLFAAYTFLSQATQVDTSAMDPLIAPGISSSSGLARAVPYLAMLTYFWGMLVFVKTCRLIVLQYLFLGSMRMGVPLLLVNIFSLLLSLALVIWTLNHIFGIQVAPLLATSAALSIVLGLALQDTLGNLFAGISLQIDHAFEIGDWLEVLQGSSKSVGQVQEISWRATTLLGFADELITVPNRIIASSQVTNYTRPGYPIIRSQFFRMPYDVNVEKVKQILLQAMLTVPEVKRFPEPLVLITETTESWLSFKAIYYIDNYGSQYTIGDKVLNAGLQRLHAEGIQTTVQRMQILLSDPSKG